MATGERRMITPWKLHDWNEMVADPSPEERAADAVAEDTLWKDIGQHHLAEIQRICNLNQGEITRRLADAPRRDADAGHPHDHPLSTIRSIVESLGGHLEVTAVFGPARVPISLPDLPPE